MDAVLVTNEVVSDLISRIRYGILCKLDMEKAYEHVNWGFIDNMLTRMRFGAKWRKWINACIITSSFEIMVNGGFCRSSRHLEVLDKGTHYRHCCLLLSCRL